MVFIARLTLQDPLPFSIQFESATIHSKKKEQLHKPLFSNALGSQNAYSQEHFRNSNLFDPSKGIRIPESKTFWLRNPLSAKFLLVESGIVGFGIWNTAQGSGIHRRLVSGIQVSWTKNPESSTGNQESTAWKPESKTLLDFLTRVETNAKPWGQTECITGDSKILRKSLSLHNCFSVGEMVSLHHGQTRAL